MRKLLIWGYVLLPMTTTISQNSNPEKEIGIWNIWTNSLVFSPKWKLDSDVQTRTWQFQKDPNNLVLRGGLTYVVSPKLELQAGYGYFETYPFGDGVDWEPSITEHRPYQQILVRLKFNKLMLTHRLRLDERLIRTPEKKNILRPHYRFQLLHPLAGKLYGFGQYEYFWTLSDWKYDQGRLHLGLGHPIGKSCKLELSYLHQWLKNEVAYNRLQINFISTLKLNSKEKS